MNIFGLSLRAFLILVSLALPALYTVEAAPVQDICAEIEQALATASSLTGLAVKHTPRCMLADKEEFRALALKAIAQDIDPTLLPFEEQGLKLLGAIEQSYPYAECLIDEYSTQASAFYAPSTDTIVIPSWFETPFVTLVHEATHALHHHHFNLLRMGRRGVLLNDGSLGIAALLEGSATVVEAKYLSNSGQSDDSQFPEPSVMLKPINARCTSQPFIIEVISSVYDYGYIFVEKLVNARGWEQINRQLRRGFITSSSILHGHIQHDVLSLPPRKDSYSCVDVVHRAPLLSNPLGEIFTRIYLRQYVPQKAAAIAADGLVADCLELIGGGKEPMLYWKTTWRTEQDTQEFYEAILSAISKRFSLKLNPSSSLIYAERPNGDFFRFKRLKNLVILESGR